MCTINTRGKFKFRNTDPLAALIIDRLNWSPVKYGAVVLLANFVLDFPPALKFNALLTQSGHPGILQDPTILVVNYVMMPIIAGFYIWSILRIESLIQELYVSNILADNTVLDSMVQELQSTLQRRWPLSVSFILSLIVTVLLLGTFLSWFAWPPGVSFINHSEIIAWLRSPMWFLTMYAVSFGLFNIGVTINVLRKMFRNQKINISPWHPDQCGGLKSISHYSTTLGYAIAVIGLTISVQTIQEIYYGTFQTAYLTWIGLAVYLVFAPLIFFLPLGTAHAAMQKAKKEHLHALSRQFDDQYEIITDSLSDSDEELETSVMKIKSLQSLYRITEKFTVWPFDIGNLRRFLTIIFIPLTPGLLTVGIELVSRYLNK